MKKVFENIYHKKIWYHGSGSGSLVSNTKEFRSFLTKYLKKHDIKSMIDIGCGDWQFMRLLDFSGMKYLGIDVVPHLIRENTRKYGKKNIAFRSGDATKMKLPKADLVLLKDVLQHWSIAEIKRFVKKLSRYPHVLLLNSAGGEKKMDGDVNSEIPVGFGRPLDLSKPPFRLRVETLLEYRSYRPIKKKFEKKRLVRLHAHR